MSDSRHYHQKPEKYLPIFGQGGKLEGSNIYLNSESLETNASNEVQVKLDDLTIERSTNGLQLKAGTTIGRLLVYNGTGGTLAAGTLVYMNGYNAANSCPTVIQADADDPSKAATHVLTAAIANTSTGYVFQTYSLTGVNTSAAGAVGDPVYLSATAGGWTLTAPTGDRIVQVIGHVAVKAVSGTIDINLSQQVQKQGVTFIQDAVLTMGKIAADQLKDKITVYNNSGAGMAEGDMVYISGFNTGASLPEVTLGAINSSATKAQYILRAVIANGASGLAYRTHTLTGLNTSAGSVGDPVYLAAAGAWTLTAPTGADEIAQRVGRVSVDDAVNGEVQFLLPGELEKAGTSQLQNLSISSDKLGANCVTAAKISNTALGSGLTGGAGTTLSIQHNVEVHTGQVNTDYGLISLCDALDLDQNDNTAIFEGTLDAVTFYKGIGSLQLESKTADPAGTHRCYEIFGGPQNWNAADNIGFWMLTDTDLNDGDLQIYIDDGVGGPQYINVPALTQAAGWTWVEVALGATVIGAVNNVGFQRNVAATFVVHVDHIIRFDATNTLTLAQNPTKESAQILDYTTPATLVEDTDVIFGDRRVIYMTDQSLVNLIYAYPY